jgi:aryl-alcohol dehydrogenase-like predicted oxidoreductase
MGPPRDRDAAKRLLRRVLELGVNLIDTADTYGPEVSEQLIAEALHPYPEGLVIATKGGLRDGGHDARPERLRSCCEASLRRLKLEQIALYQLHAPDPAVPLEESVGALKDLQAEGKIRHVGVSNVSMSGLERARAVVDIVSVQNLYNLLDRAYEDVVAVCERDGLAFIPWFPLADGRLAKRLGPLARLGRRRGVRPSQMALAWLLRRSPVIVPVPGTSSIEHLEENMAAAEHELSDAEFDQMERLYER